MTRRLPKPRRRPAAGPASPGALRRSAWLAGLTVLAALLAPAAAAQEAQVVAPAVAAPAPPAVPELPRIDGPLNLRSAWRAALAHDPGLQAARAGARAGREGVVVSRSQWLPQVTLSASRQRNDLRTRSAASSTQPGGVTEQAYTSSTQQLTLRQAIWQPAQDAAVAVAAAQAAEAESGELQARQDLALRVAEAYFEYLLAEQQIALVEAQTAAHARQLEAARRALEAGSGTRTDIDEAQARLDLDGADALLAHQQLERARLMLEQQVGQPVESAARLDAARFDATPPEPGALDDWLRLAAHFSAELQALQARRDAAAHEVERARARHQPTLDLVLQHSRNSPESSTRQDSRSLNRSIGLQFNLPIYAGGGHDAALRQAQAELQRQEALLAAARLDLQLRVQQTHRSVQEGLQRVRALQQALRSAEQMVRSVGRSYQAGVRSTVDVLDAEQRLVEARRNLLQTRLTTLLSTLRLRALGGVVADAEIERLDAFFAPSVGSATSGLNPADAGRPGAGS